MPSSEFEITRRLKVCHVTILAGLSFVAPGAEACVVADADSGVFARRLALRFQVKDEADRDTPGRVRASGAHTGERHQRGKQERCKEHGRMCFVAQMKSEKKRSGGRMEEEKVS